MMQDIMPVVESVIQGLPYFILHLGAATAVWLIGLLLYMAITAHDELKLIRDGNTAAAVSLGGAAIGLALPLAFCLAASVSVWDVAIWGSIALLLQLIAFRAVDFVIGDLSKRIEADQLAAALFLTMAKVALAGLNAAAVAG